MVTAGAQGNRYSVTRKASWCEAVPVVVVTWVIVNRGAANTSNSQVRDIILVYMFPVLPQNPLPYV